MKDRVEQILDEISEFGESTGKVTGWLKSKSIYFLYAAVAIVVLGTLAFLSKFADGYKKNKF
jgi:hypothetical protein